MVSWLEELIELSRRRTPLVLVTIAAVRGHAPRNAGSKMLVTADHSYGSVGGGNLEQSVLTRARQLLKNSALTPELLTITLNPSAGPHGVQCCGGEVTLLLEPIPGTPPTVAIFGAGHVGKALVHVLSLLPIDVRLIDSRQDRLDLPSFPEQASAKVHTIHAPVPESVIAELPTGTHLLIMTHDHAEDIAILDTALRRRDLGFIGLIGSAVKWSHFRRKLGEQGHDADTLERVTTPIGLPEVPGKSPAAIAIATAAQLLRHLEIPESNF